MAVRVQQDYPLLPRHGVGGIREPREDDIVMHYASRARIDILRAEEELASPDEVRVGFSILGASNEGKREREHQGADDDYVGSIHKDSSFRRVENNIPLRQSQNDSG